MEYVVTRDSEPKAKWSKKRKELKVLMCVSSISEELSRTSVRPPVPPPVTRAPVTSSLSQSSKTFFPQCSSLFGSTCHFEDLIEATQDYRQQPCLETVTRIGEFIFKGCLEAGREDMVRELSGCFKNTLPEGEMREGFEEFINSKLGQKKEEEVKWKEKNMRKHLERSLSVVNVVELWIKM